LFVVNATAGAIHTVILRCANFTS